MTQCRPRRRPRRRPRPPSPRRCWSAAATAPAWSPRCPSSSSATTATSWTPTSTRIARPASSSCAWSGTCAGSASQRPEIAAALAELAGRFELGWEITYSDERARVAIFASRTPHCLYDLLLTAPARRAGRRSRPGDLEPRRARVGGRALRRALRARAGRPADKARRRGGAAAPARRGAHRSGRARALHADPLARRSSRAGRDASSTSTTRSCRRSSARSRTTRPRSAA